MMYFAFGQAIDSDFESTFWPEAPTLTHADIVIKKEKISFSETWDSTTFFCEPQQDGTLAVGLKEVGFLHVITDRLIHVQPCNNAHAKDIALFLAGTAVLLALTLKGFYVFHGNAAKIGEFCTIVAGHSGTGKSTVAQAFLKANIPLLTDDMCVIDTSQNPPVLYPSFPFIKLWKKTLDELHIPYQTSQQINPSLEKYYIPMKDLFWPTPLPISHIYFLEKSTDSSSLQLHTLTDTELFEKLMLHAHRFFYLKRLNMTKQHFHWASTLSQTVKGGKLIRPENQMVADDIVKIIQQGVLDE